MEVFEGRPEMVLRREDFASFQANWEPKADNIRRIAGELNLGLQNICFLDDSHFERNQVRAVLPDVIVPELPADPRRIVPSLQATGEFEFEAVTDEDRRRAELIEIESERVGARSRAVTLEDYLRSLDLMITASPVRTSNLDRVYQLVQKTNQFNVTTRRHDHEQLASWARDPAVYSVTFTAEDRFGPYGLVGVLIAVSSGADYRIDTFLLSCRAMGRTIETAMMDHLLRWARERETAGLVGEYLPTKKNQPVESLYPSLGFTPVVGGHLFRRPMPPASEELNRYVRIVEGVE